MNKSKLIDPAKARTAIDEALARGKAASERGKAVLSKTAELRQKLGLKPRPQPVVGKTKAEMAAGASSGAKPTTTSTGGGFKFGSTPTGGGKPATTPAVTSGTVSPDNVVKPSGPAPGTRMMNMRSGGSVGSASKRADGCAVRGKTRGKFV
jgi:hypothetical protein